MAKRAPAGAVARLELNAQGALLVDGAVAPDGCAVYTSYSINMPCSPKAGDSTQLLPNQHMPTIGDHLSEKGNFVGVVRRRMNDAMAGRAHPVLQHVISIVRVEVSS